MGTCCEFDYRMWINVAVPLRLLDEVATNGTNVDSGKWGGCGSSKPRALMLPTYIHAPTPLLYPCPRLHSSLRAHAHPGAPIPTPADFHRFWMLVTSLVGFIWLGATVTILRAAKRLHAEADPEASSGVVISTKS